MGTLCPQGNVTPSDCDPPTIDRESLPAGQVGESYDANLSYTSFDAIDPEFEVSSGSLPPGLSLNVSGGSNLEARIMGTPTTAGTYSFSIRIVDNCGLDTQALTILVEPPCPVLAFGATPLPQGSVGVAYQGSLDLSGGAGAVAVRRFTGTLPPGLSLTSSSLEGTPTAAGSFTFSLEAEDSCVPRQRVTREFTVTINEEGVCSALVLDAAPFPDGEVDVAYDQPVVIFGGVAAFSVAVTVGALPPGLSLTSDERLAGTPTTAGTFDFTIQLTDSCTPPQVVEQAYTLVIAAATGCAAPPELQLTGLPGGQVGVAYPEPIVPHSGGEPPLTFTISSGQLPDGLFLVTSNGEIVGTPTGPAGTFNFEVTLTDSCDPPRSDSAASQIIITGGGGGCEALTLNPLPLEEGTVGTPYEHFFGEWTNGGEGDLSFFSQAPSEPPPGLTLDQDTGLLSGTPTTAGVHQFVLMVTDECAPQQQAFELITITVS